MKINSCELISSLNSALTEYNTQFYDNGEIQLPLIEDDGEKLLPLIEDDGEISDENLAKIQKISVVLNTRSLTQEEVSSFNQELQAILSKMNLKVFMITVLGKKSPVKFDTSFLDALNENVENIQLRGIDLSEKDAKTFSKFKGLKRLSLDKCNITNPNIISELNENVSISIKGNQIDPKSFEQMIKLLIKHNGRIETGNNKLEKIAEAYKSKKIDIQTYLDTKEDVDYEMIQGLNITIDDSFTPSDEELANIISTLNKVKGIRIVTDVNNFLRVSSAQKLEVPSKIIIRSANELSTKIMQENPNIQNVEIQDLENSVKEQAEPYTREEYMMARQKIDEIISEIQMPEEGVEDREKIIFSQVYTKLAELMKYDDYAISQEGRKDDKLQTTCRNLYGGLVQGKCVCAGYADILRNTLECCGITAKFAGGNIDRDEGAQYYIKDPVGHAWNMVTLDGKNYWTDLTWDRENIVAKRYPLRFCLKSTKDFGHKGFKVFNISTEEQAKCTESLTAEEQAKLFSEGRHYVATQKQNNISYLSSMVMHSAENRAKSITN